MIHLHSSTASQRAHWVSQLIAEEGTYGVVSQLSRSQQVSRQSLYTWKAKGEQALEAALEPSHPQPGAADRLSRAVLTLLVQGHASYRGIQACLQELLGQHVSLGTIRSIVQEAGQRAQNWLQQQVSEQERVVALDEQYSSQRGEAYLNVIDVHSSQVWATVPPVWVDGESWMLVLWYLREQGVTLKGTVSDGGTAIHEALETTKALSSHQRDIWHLFHVAAQVQTRLEKLVQAEEQRWVVIERQEQHLAQTGKRASGRPTKTTSGEHEQQLMQWHRVLTAVTYLFAQLHELLEVVVLSSEPEPRVRKVSARRGDLQAVIDLLQEVIEVAPPSLQKDVRRVSKQVQQALPALLHFAYELEEGQNQAIAELGERTVGLIAWAWQRRAILGQQPQQLLEAMDPAWRPTAERLLTLWNQAVRASSAVENWHSIVRPHLAVHRSLSAGFLALLAVWHNHRVAPRGEHKGQSPLQRGGMANAPTDWLLVLGYPPLPVTPFERKREGKLKLVA